MSSIPVQLTIYFRHIDGSNGDESDLSTLFTGPKYSGSTTFQEADTYNYTVSVFHTDFHADGFSYGKQFR